LILQHEQKTKPQRKYPYYNMPIPFFFFFSSSFSSYDVSARFRAMASSTFVLHSSYFSEVSVDVSKQIQVLQGEVVSPTPNPQPAGPRYPVLSGSSPSTCPAWEPLPVAVLPPA
jgi:hypothetical protein